MMIGREIDTRSLTGREIEDVVEESLSDRSWRNLDVLVLVPDATRHAPVDQLFALIVGQIGRDARRLDVLVASGTHRPMRPEEIIERIGGPWPGVSVFAHAFDDERELTSAGRIPGDELARMTSGLYRDDLDVRVNRRLFEYDRVLILGPVTPHEAAGFSGGNKYLIPGVAGAGVTSAFHWMAAVITNPVVNGVRENPVRRVLDRAAGLVGADIVCLSFVVRADGGLGCLYAGSPRESWARAAEYSARCHIRYVPRPYSLIAGLAPVRLSDLWVGGKVMYKLEPILADGGELVISAPHITDLSAPHGARIREVGYHVRDYFLGQWDRFSEFPKLILAHSTNLRGIGTFEHGTEHPRVQVTLATGIDSETCRSVNLGYRDPATFNVDALRGREDEGILVVDDAGQDLYRLESER